MLYKKRKNNCHGSKSLYFILIYLFNSSYSLLVLQRHFTFTCPNNYFVFCAAYCETSNTFTVAYCETSNTFTVAYCETSNTFTVAYCETSNTLTGSTHFLTVMA